MAFKKIRLQDHKACPACGSNKGIRFSLRARAVCFNNWGNNPTESELEKTEINQKSKTARCIDCGKRFEFID